VVARAAWTLLLLPVVFDGSAAARAAEPLVLVVGERRPVLRDGLQQTADGAIWITLHDAQEALTLRAKRLIPRPLSGRRPVARRERDDWVLCDAEGCTTYDGTLLGTTDEPAFDLERLARPLGYRLTRNGGQVRLRPPAGREARGAARGHLGNLAPDLVLKDLDGVARSLRSHPGRRVLVVTWAPWSPTRDLLATWAVHHEQRASRKLDLWLVALDVEGAERVKDFVPTGFQAPILLDRRADLARTLPMNDVGYWFLIDELGLLRADGEKLDAVALQWIDLHLGEPLAAPLEARVGLPAPDLAALRASVALAPKVAGPRIALRDALGAEQRAEALAVTSELIALQPQVAAHAFALAALQLDAGEITAALASLDEARRRTPGAWYLRKQYWALWQPNRFYMGPIDVAWQKEQRKRERDELDHPKRRQ